MPVMHLFQFIRAVYAGLVEAFVARVAIRKLPQQTQARSNVTNVVK
jgi:hypothetical protein